MRFRLMMARGCCHASHAHARCIARSRLNAHLDLLLSNKRVHDHALILRSRRIVAVPAFLRESEFRHTDVRHAGLVGNSEMRAG